MAVKQQTKLELTGDLIAQGVKSFTLSKRYTHIMVKCSIFNIIYRRLQLDESELKTRKYRGISFVVLKSSSQAKHPLVNAYLTWLDGIKDAIDKNYLKEIFIFMKNAAGDIAETYNFKLKYNTNPHLENKSTLVHVQDETMALLQVISDLGKTKKLEDMKLVIEFTYHNDTPAEYEPPGFLPALLPNCSKVSVCDKFLGMVNTGFHKITCRAQGLLNVDRALTPMPTSLLGTKGGSVPSLMSDKSSKVDKFGEKMVIEAENEEKVDKARKTPAAKFNTSNITISDQVEPDNSMLSNDCSEDLIATAGYLDCICQLTIPLDGVAVVRCSRCERQYHAPCHGYRNESPLDVNFACIRCDTTDRILCEFSIKDRPLFIRIRLIMYYMEKDGKFPEQIANLLSASDKEKVLEKLKQFEIYDDKKKNVNQFNLSQVMHMFFNNGDSQFLS